MLQNIVSVPLIQGMPIKNTEGNSLSL